MDLDRPQAMNMNQRSRFVCRQPRCGGPASFFNEASRTKRFLHRLMASRARLRGIERSIAESRSLRRNSIRRRRQGVLRAPAFRYQRRTSQASRSTAEVTESLSHLRLRRDVPPLRPLPQPAMRDPNQPRFLPLSNSSSHTVTPKSRSKCIIQRGIFSSGGSKQNTGYFNNATERSSETLSGVPTSFGAVASLGQNDTNVPVRFCHGWRGSPPRSSNADNTNATKGGCPAPAIGDSPPNMRSHGPQYAVSRNGGLVELAGPPGNMDQNDYSNVTCYSSHTKKPFFVFRVEVDPTDDAIPASSSSRGNENGGARPKRRAILCLSSTPPEPPKMTPQEQMALDEISSGITGLNIPQGM